MVKLSQFKDQNEALSYCVSTFKNASKPSILVEQNRNLGDTLHLTPVIRHYRMKFPDAYIIFMIAHRYLNAHEFNPHVNEIVTIPHLEPTHRIQLRKSMVAQPNIQVIAPSIHPYGAIWKELAWSYPNIADQYMHNSGITDLKPVGGRKLEVVVTDHDKNWAANFMKSNNLTRDLTCALEYHSYSAPVKWKGREFQHFVARAKTYGIKCISICGPRERIIGGTVDASGITWRQAAALYNLVGSFVGVGSGLTMLAASAERVPHIMELYIPTSIDMKSCGYSNSLIISNPDPLIVADHLWYKVLH